MHAGGGDSNPRSPVLKHFYNTFNAKTLTTETRVSRLSVGIVGSNPASVCMYVVHTYVHCQIIYKVVFSVAG
jgi:hypothetical protein